MTDPHLAFWQKLFKAANTSEASEEVRVRQLIKGGRPFLLIPCAASEASTTLDLYPAQTPRARIARRILRTSLSLGLGVGTQPLSLQIARSDPFTKFLSDTSDTPQDAPLRFGVLAGNPAADTQRFLILLFGRQGNPAAVVKVGLSARARSLVQKELSFLDHVPAEMPGIPRLRGAFEDSERQALALEYFSGTTPSTGKEFPALSRLLHAWVNPQQSFRLSALPDIKRLEAKSPGNPHIKTILETLAERSVSATLQHGDFAPWNIKVDAQQFWTALDWERGELEGVPGWDWFHYFLQKAILVDRLGTNHLIQLARSILSAKEFREYASRAGIGGIEHPLMLAYLLHSAEVIQPAEGLIQTRELIRELSSRWITSAPAAGSN